eukprot:g2188.t1
MHSKSECLPTYTVEHDDEMGRDESGRRGGRTSPYWNKIRKTYSSLQSFAACGQKFREAEAIRKETEKHAYQDKLISDLVMKSADSVIGRMKRRLETVKSRNYNYAFLKDAERENYCEKLSRRQCSRLSRGTTKAATSVIAAATIASDPTSESDSTNAKHMRTSLLCTNSNVERSPNFASPAFQRKKVYQFSDLVQRSEKILKQKTNASQRGFKSSDPENNAFRAALQLEIIAKEKASQMRVVKGIALDVDNRNNILTPLEVPSVELIDFTLGLLPLRKISRQERAVLKLHLPQSSVHSLFKNMFWFVHNKHFNVQVPSRRRDRVRKILQRKISVEYVDLVELTGVASSKSEDVATVRNSSCSPRLLTVRTKDTLTKYLPIVLGTAVYFCFYFVCPLSRVDFEKRFHTQVVSTAYDLLCGLEVFNIETKFNRLFKRSFDTLTKSPPLFQVEAKEKATRMTNQEINSLPFMVRRRLRRERLERSESDDCSYDEGLENTISSPVATNSTILPTLVRRAAASSSHRVSSAKHGRDSMAKRDHRVLSAGMKTIPPRRSRVSGREELSRDDISPLLSSFLGVNRMDRELSAKLTGRRLFRTVPKARKKDHVTRRTTADLFAGQLSELLFYLKETGPIDIIGYSMGGIIASRFAACYPHCVRSLILVAPAGLPSMRAKLPAYLDAVLSIPGMSDIIGAHIVRSFSRKELADQWCNPGESRFEEQYRIEKRRRKVEPALRRAIGSALTSMPWGEIGQDLKKLNEHEHVHVIALWGANDKVVPPEGASEIASILPRVIVNIVDDLGHAAPIEAAELVAYEIFAALGTAIEAKKVGEKTSDEAVGVVGNTTDQKLPS